MNSMLKLLMQILLVFLILLFPFGNNVFGWPSIYNMHTIIDMVHSNIGPSYSNYSDFSISRIAVLAFNLFLLLLLVIQYIISIKIKNYKFKNIYLVVIFVFIPYVFFMDFYTRFTLTNHSY
ncbi:hypothetical protein PsAD26_03392 [Pseudovibrio sp. Ad26]|nr:hypothetical protein PsAD26_03392 [Pseudovibrio sp. Ad26]